MIEEKFSTKERIDAMKTYGSCSDEVCYASRRLRKIGAVPYEGDTSGYKKDVYRRAIEQARQNNQMVSVYLSTGDANGMFLVTPKQNPEHIDLGWPYFVKNTEKARWDKPIEEQKREEEFDRFQIYEYKERLDRTWGVATTEGRYAAERLERMGVEPYNSIAGSNVQDMFWAAMKQAKENNNKVGVYFCSGVINGLFVVAPENMADDKEYATLKFEQYVKNQKNLRYDKPIPQQKFEELHGHGIEGGRK